MFYFQQLFNTAMSGIDSGGATAGAVQVAQYILLASLLFGIYEAWARGGHTLSGSDGGALLRGRPRDGQLRDRIP